MSIQSQIDRIVGFRNASLAAVANKGVNVPSDATIDDLPDLIDEIQTGSTPVLQTKTVSPSTSQQTVSPDSGYDGLSSVTVNAMPSGTAGTPTATKGSVSDHSIAVTPSVTNTTGYITGGVKSGTAVTVTAEELAYGTKTITANGEGIDVVGYLDVDVAVPPSGGGTITEDGNGDIELGKTGDVALITPLSVTANDTYTAPANTGYSPVDVNVSGGGVTMVSIDVSDLLRTAPSSPWQYGCLVDGASTVTRDENYHVFVSCPENSMFVVETEMMPPSGSTGTVTFTQIYSSGTYFYYAVFAGASGGSIY